MTTPEPTVLVTRHTVTCVPLDCGLPGADAWALQVERRRDGSWTVSDGWAYLRADGSWTQSRVGIWHDEATALRLAREAAPKVVINGRSVADALALAEYWKEQRDV